MAEARILGAVLAGGQARRFGSDKALALLDGKPLIEHVLTALSAQTESVVVCGRAWPKGVALQDRPHSDLGPLAGLNAALHYASSSGFDGVLTAGCDTPMLPPDLMSLLGGGDGAAIFEDMPVVGYWPSRLSAALDLHLEKGGDRSIRRWAKLNNARFVKRGSDIANINTPADLDAFSRKP